jgi:hypothetical protein
MFLVANHPFSGPEGVSLWRGEIARMLALAELPAFVRKKATATGPRFLRNSLFFPGTT